MKHATKQEASAARLAALEASREKRTHAKHMRWAEEMERAGWVTMSPRDAGRFRGAPEREDAPILRDRDGCAWVRDENSMYTAGNLTMSQEDIKQQYGPVREG